MEFHFKYYVYTKEGALIIRTLTYQKAKEIADKWQGVVKTLEEKVVYTSEQV
jgi:hypothetical protein